MKKLLVALSLIPFLLGGMSGIVEATDLTCSNGSATLTVTKSRGSVKIYTLDWTAKSDGTWDCTLSLSGYIMMVDTDPGSTAPTASYDLTYTDSQGIDILDGLLANRHTSTSERVKISDLPPYSNGSGTISIANNSQNAAVGEIVFYIYQEK